MIYVRNGIVLLMACLSCTAGAERMGKEQLDKVLDQLEKTLSKVETLRTEFQQEKRIALFDDTLKANGRLLFKRPRKVRFEITRPFRSVLIVNDRNVAKYEWTRKTGGWRKLRLYSTDALQLVMNQIADWMQGKFRAQSRMFALHGQTNSGKEYIVLTSKPKSLKSVINRIEILLNKERTKLQSITIYEPGGDSTLLKFTAEKRNSKLLDGTFDTHLQKPVESAEVEN